MKDVLCKVFSFVKRFFLFLKVHIVVNAGIKNQSDDKENEGN